LKKKMRIREKNIRLLRKQVLALSQEELAEKMKENTYPYSMSEIGTVSTMTLRAH